MGDFSLQNVVMQHMLQALRDLKGGGSPVEFLGL